MESDNPNKQTTAPVVPATQYALRFIRTGNFLPNPYHRTWTSDPSSPFIKRFPTREAAEKVRAALVRPERWQAVQVPFNIPYKAPQ
jgi:hypothetical protein